MVAARHRVVLQARTTSTRLPGKVLLPVCGLPLVVLAARLAARDGIETVVATSDDPSDDRLAEALSRHGIRHVRGPLDDVLGRFIAATAALDDGDVCVRLTSDNVFPDGDFVRRLIAAAEGNSHGYAGIAGALRPHWRMIQGVTCSRSCASRAPRPACRSNPTRMASPANP